MRGTAASCAVFQTMPAGDSSAAVLSDLVQQYATPGDQCRALARIVRDTAAAQGNARRRCDFVAQLCQTMVDRDTRLAAAMALVQHALDGEELQELLTRVVVMLAPVGVTSVMDGNLQPPPPLPGSTPLPTPSLASAPTASTAQAGSAGGATATSAAHGSGPPDAVAEAGASEVAQDGVDGDEVEDTPADAAVSQHGSVGSVAGAETVTVDKHGEAASSAVADAASDGGAGEVEVAATASMDPDARAEEAAADLEQLKQRHDDAGKGAKPAVVPHSRVDTSQGARS